MMRIRQYLSDKSKYQDAIRAEQPQLYADIWNNLSIVSRDVVMSNEKFEEAEMCTDPLKLFMIIKGTHNGLGKNRAIDAYNNLNTLRQMYQMPNEDLARYNLRFTNAEVAVQSSDNSINLNDSYHIHRFIESLDSRYMKAKNKLWHMSKTNDPAFPKTRIEAYEYVRDYQGIAPTKIFKSNHRKSAAVFNVNKYKNFNESKNYDHEIKLGNYNTNKGKKHQKGNKNWNNDKKWNKPYQKKSPNVSNQSNVKDGDESPRMVFNLYYHIDDDNVEQDVDNNTGDIINESIYNNIDVDDHISYDSEDKTYLNSHKEYDDDVKCYNVFMFTITKKLDYYDDIVFDTGAQVSCFRNSNLLDNLRKAKVPIYINGYGTQKKLFVDEIGDFSPIKNVYFSKDAQANVLSMHHLEQYGNVKYDEEQHMFVFINDEVEFHFEKRHNLFIMTPVGSLIFAIILPGYTGTIF